MFSKNNRDIAHSHSARKKTLGQALAAFFIHAGPGFIKLGQLLAARDDMLGPELAGEMHLLRDQVPADISANIRRILSSELGSYLSEFTIDFTPIASASVAQVYRAHNANGECFAFKLLRPGVRQRYKSNIQLLRILAKIGSWFFPEWRGLRLCELAEVIAEASRVELNMQLEAAAASKIAQSLQRSRLGVYVPKVLWQYTTKNLLVMEWIDGTPLYQLAQHPLPPGAYKKLAKKLITAFFHQVYLDGFFHADLHPGNVLLDRYNRLVLLDFGLVSALSQRDKETMAEIFYHFLTKNYDKVAEIHHKVGYIPKKANIPLFALACRSIAEPIIGQSSREIRMSALLQRLFAVALDFEMETQPQLLLLQKNLLSLEGTLHLLDSRLNLWEIAQPWLEQWYRREFGWPRRIAGITDDLAALYQRLKERLES